MSRPPSAELVADLSASPFEPIGQIGMGGMGEVYKVRHRGFGHEAVMKLTRRASDELTEDLTRRLLREGRVLKSLVHPNIVPALDLGYTLSKRAYLVTELVVGKTLKDEVREHGPLPIELSVEICCAMLSALQVAHEAGIVHRDVKPDNVMLTKPDDDGKRVTKVLDFGVAKILGDEMKAQLGGVPATVEGLMVGTPAFAAPEQISAKPVDSRTDLYGVGGVLFFILTGRAPFIGLDVNEVMVAHLTQAPDPPSRLRPQVSTALDEVVLRALAKDPADRFSTAREMLAALEAASLASDQAATEVLPNQDDRYLAPMSTGSTIAAIQSASESAKPPEVALPFAKTVPIQMVPTTTAEKRTARGTVIGADPPPAHLAPETRADWKPTARSAVDGEQKAPTEIGRAPDRIGPRFFIAPILLGMVLAAIIISVAHFSGAFR